MNFSNKLVKKSGVVELADTYDSKSYAARHGSSTLPSSTEQIAPEALSVKPLIKYMILSRTKIKKSAIAGKGLFAMVNIPKKSVVFIFPVLKNLQIITEKDFNRSWVTKNPTKRDLVIRKSGVRYIKDYFLYCVKDEKKTLYFNHSDHPNILYHCGIGFAKQNIKKNAELTVDYRYFDTSKSDNFINVETRKKVRKYNSDYLLKKSTQELLDLLNS